MPAMSELTYELNEFSTEFDSAREARAENSRGEFLQQFPKSKLKDLTLAEYAIGQQTLSFCTAVEVKTKSWANINGATAKKFGIYYGRIKSDPIRKYRFSSKFGKNKIEAFSSVKRAVLSLIEDARRANFKSIDENPLSQMFKAKIISLYFPDKYINICGEKHLRLIASEIGIKNQEYNSEIQHLILKQKLSNPVTKHWSNPKFMLFLVGKFNPNDPDGVDAVAAVRQPRKKRDQEINFDDINADRSKFGKMSEEYALKWEHNRLRGAELGDFINRIEDLTKKPSNGYDFRSFSSPTQIRYIEVKSVGRDRRNGSYRFFLSQNEHTVSVQAEMKDHYFFYLVFYNKESKPCDLEICLAQDFYKKCEQAPAAYVLRFDR